jgi:hypothetical protein
MTGNLLRMLTDTGQDSSEIVRDDSVTNPLTEESDELVSRSHQVESVHRELQRHDRDPELLTTMTSSRCRLPRLLKKLM